MDEEENYMIMSLFHRILPAREFNGLWESLVFESPLKDSLLSLVQTMLSPEVRIDQNLISRNRVILLYGPPGTGKTSLCKALAQKLSICLANPYINAELFEINVPSLFSKCFWESNKLVSIVFSKINRLASDSTCLTIVLIDNVESLGFIKQSSIKRQESYEMELLNIIIQQVELLRTFPNVLLLTTSKICSDMDLAFVDHADIKQYIGSPTLCSIYTIFQSCVRELQRKKVIDSYENIMDFELLELSSIQGSQSTNVSLTLYEVSKQCVGLSGRTLRKLPFLAHAYFIKENSVSLEEFLEALRKAVVKHKSDSDDYQKTSEARGNIPLSPK